MYQTYSQTQDHIPVNQTPRPHHTTQELIQTYNRGRGQAAGKSSTGIDPLEPAHDPYRAGFKERSGKLNACDRDMQIPNKTLLFS